VGLLCGVRLEEGVDILLHVLCYYCVVLEEALEREVECFSTEGFSEVVVAFDEKCFFAEVIFNVCRENGDENIFGG